MERSEHIRPESGRDHFHLCELHLPAFAREPLRRLQEALLRTRARANRDVLVQESDAIQGSQS